MPVVSWDYDASTSRTLRLLAHLPPAAIGGAALLAVGIAGRFVVSNPTALLSPSALFLALLVLVGGPGSLLYLWPMLTDPDQRPSAAEFSGAEGIPFSLRSVAAAAVCGAVGIAGAFAVGLPFGTVYRAVVAAVFAPILVAAATTRGRLEGGELTVNGREVPRARVASVRWVAVGGQRIAWVGYARGSGVFLPRLLVVPGDAWGAVRSALESGGDAEPKPRDPAVRIAAALLGGCFLLAAAGASRAVAAPDARIALAGLLGGVGALFVLFGLRG